jgi:hypothetical protein
MPTLTYPLDTTGTAASNLVSNEVQTLTEANYETQRILIPEFAPFYLNNFILQHIDVNGQPTTLLEDADYVLCLPYIGASRSTGKLVYGGISINRADLNGELRVWYQTVGGSWTVDALYIYERLAEKAYNPRTTVWDAVSGIPEIFPPTSHALHMDFLYGHKVLVDAINNVATTIASEPSGTTPFVKHFLDTSNPHEVTKDQVGLGLVENLRLATPLEIASPQSQTAECYITLTQLMQILSKYKLK